MVIERIQLRRGIAETLAEVNPTLLAGELCIETDTGRFKLGDGVTDWANLGYTGGEQTLPDNDDKAYVMKNGAWVAATVVEQPAEWSPAVDDVDDIVLTLDEDMTPYQLTGSNTEVNS